MAASAHAPNPMPGRRVHSAAHYTAGYDPSRPGHYPSVRNPEYSAADGSPTLRRFPGFRQTSSNSTSASPSSLSKKLASPSAHPANSNASSPAAKHSLRGASRASAYSRVHPAGPSKYSPLTNDATASTTSSSRRRSSRRASSVLQRSSHGNASPLENNIVPSNMDPTAEPPSLPELPKIPRSPDHLPQRFSDQYHSRPSKVYPPTMSRPIQPAIRPRPPPIPLPRASPPSRSADAIGIVPNPVAIAPCNEISPDAIVRSISNPHLTVPSDTAGPETVTDIVSPSPPPIALSKPKLAPLPISQVSPFSVIQPQPDIALAPQLAVPSFLVPPAKRPGKNNIHLRRPPPLITSPDTPGFAGNDGPANPLLPSLIEPIPLRRDERPPIERDATSFVTKGSDSNDGSGVEGDTDVVDARTSLGESEQGTTHLKAGTDRRRGVADTTCLGMKPAVDADIDPYMFDEASNSSFGGSEDTVQLPKNARRSRAPGDAGEVQEDDFQMVGGDGALFDGGFILFSDGRIQTPEKVMRKTSEGLAVEGIPTSSNNLIIVRSLSEFKKSHTFKTNNNGSSTLGRGAAGRVYLAVHEPSQRKIAVKEINFFHQEKRNQLRKELVTLISHQSRFLVRSYGAFYDGNGIVHVTLEYMDCGSLSDVIQKRGAVPEAVISKIAEHCLRGLCFLHSNHILHRDVKTGNILLSRKLCRAKLSDFGLARDLKEDVNNEGRTDSVTKTFVGTLNYMSPERLNGQEYTYASDIWALGISLVECILGRCPFDKMKGFFEVFYATESPLAEQVRKLVSHELYDLIRLMTDREASNRPTARELLQHNFIQAGRHNVNDLRRWLDDIPRLDCDDKDMSQGSVRLSRSVDKKAVGSSTTAAKLDRKSKASTRGHALDWKKQRCRPK